MEMAKSLVTNRLTFSHVLRSYPVVLLVIRSHGSGVGVGTGFVHQISHPDLVDQNHIRFFQYMYITGNAGIKRSLDIHIQT